MKSTRHDPHVNCFIPRRDSLRDEYDGKENALTSPRETRERRREREKESLLVYDRDMTAAPDFILLCAIRAGSPPPINALV